MILSCSAALTDTTPRRYQRLLCLNTIPPPLSPLQTDVPVERKISQDDHFLKFNKLVTIPKPSAVRRIRGHLAEKVPIGPDARLVRHHRHLGEGQILAHQTALVVAPARNESHLVDQRFVILVEIPQTGRSDVVVEFDILFQYKQSDVGEETFVVVVRMDEDAIDLGILFRAVPLLEVGFSQVEQ